MLEFEMVLPAAPLLWGLVGLVLVSAVFVLMAHDRHA